jgi:hypothetical protein
MSKIRTKVRTAHTVTSGKGNFPSPLAPLSGISIGSELIKPDARASSFTGSYINNLTDIGVHTVSEKDPEFVNQKLSELALKIEEEKTKVQTLELLSKHEAAHLVETGVETPTEVKDLLGPIVSKEISAAVDDPRINELMEKPEFQAQLIRNGSNIEKYRTTVESYRNLRNWMRGLSPEASKDLWRITRHFEDAARHVVLPPWGPISNIETLMMAFSYAYQIMSPIRKELDVPELALYMERFSSAKPPVRKLIKATEYFLDSKDSEPLLMFGIEWLKSSYARLEVGHKLAASLCLTDVPEDIEVKAPWMAWSLVIPDGVIYDPGGTARIWVLGTEPMFMVADGQIVRCNLPKENIRPEDEINGRRWLMIRNLIRGACLALSNPEDFSKDRAGEGWKSSKKSNRKGPPELSQARFLLSAPVKVDLREEVRRVVTGERKGSSPKVQFLVRGHWRNQACGPKQSLRKTIWIQPFWKGDEEARILLRHTEIQGKEPEKGA